MESDFIKMAAKPPMMSTPIKGKYSSFFQEIVLLPYKLFGRCSRENSEQLKMDSPKSGSSIPPGITMSPCRHSLRLLSNGYYICDEDSFCWDDLGNVSFSPTQCTVSYKENMVRIWKRRRHLIPRRLDLPDNEYCDDMQTPYYEDLNDIEPLVVEQIYSSGFDDSGNTHLCPPSPESDTDRASSGYSRLMDDENGAQCDSGKFPKILHQPSNSTKNDDNSSSPLSPGATQKVINDDKKSCAFSHDSSSWGATDRRDVKKSPTDSIAATLTPAIGSDLTDTDDSIQRRVMILLFFVTLLLLCLILWWDRSPDIGIRTRIQHGL
ncbi:transmembrane protein 71 [Phyllobates terribilis]|uniref:transmembrane protein 71 n=1 Tax=Phyllobates terribilis TaxID=111132 RepID=UPI003CCAD9E7